MLEIFVITYNRSKFLEKTLMYLKDSKFANFQITVQNNCSTDDTIEVFHSFQNNYGESFKSLKLISNLFNFGPNVNFLKAIELSQSKYTWVLCDDDVINAADVDDVLKILHEENFDLIHVGAHPERERVIFALKEIPRKLIEKGYRYFTYSSFIPCNIFKTELFQKQFLISGYNNVTNAYPHMPYLFDVFLKDKLIYISKRQIVTARTEGQCYNQTEWLEWWINTSKLLKDKQDVRLAFFDQFKKFDNSTQIDYKPIFYLFNLEAQKKNKIINRFIKDFFSFKEKIDFFIFKIKFNPNYYNRLIKKLKSYAKKLSVFSKIEL
jgi:glycosyltransferase involved in cell wall biosynthesis